MSNQLPESLDFRKEQPHLLTSIEERLRGEELYPEETAEDAARRTQWERLQMMAKIPNNLQGMQIIGKELASYKNDPEAYGHLVLDSLENTLQPNDHGSTAQQEKLEQQLENGWDDVQSHEQRWKVMDQIQHDRAFELPQTEDQIRRSRYFYMDPTGIVRVEIDIIERFEARAQRHSFHSRGSNRKQLARHS
jgi:hypothetical protein